MNQHVEQMITNLDVMIESNQVLKAALSRCDDDKAHEAISVMLMQAMALFGAESVAMKRFFPVMDVIKQRIDNLDLEGALRQAETFELQLIEIQQLMKQ